jgi:hypothetical protein
MEHLYELSTAGISLLLHNSWPTTRGDIQTHTSHEYGKYVMKSDHHTLPELLLLISRY